MKEPKDPTTRRELASDETLPFDPSSAPTPRPLTPTPATPLPPEAVQLTAAAASRPDAGAEPRYRRGGLLGVGGMGEVGAAEDRWIGRTVAWKTLRAEDASSETLQRRFLREMQIQGQLEHPGIVPVYDFGRGDDEAQLHFTMRRVRGPTLAQILSSLRRADPEVARVYTRRKLLTAFVSICNAIHYAHTRGVVHRDLKPANVMLGEFGEVYVLDWGIAKVLDAHFGTAALGLTNEGAVVGTPAYMAPEQLLGRNDEHGPCTDLYALGLILHELLTLVPVHEGRTLPQIREATLAGLDARPSRVRADVPPELDDICARACAPAIHDRYAGVADLAQAIERYLDGDRDLERRRQLAADKAAQAIDVARRVAEAEARGEDTADDRAAALRTVAEALALDAEQPEARRTLVKLLVEAPARMPAAAAAEMAEARRNQRREGAKIALYTFLSWCVAAPIIALLGIRSWAVYVTGCTLTLAATLWAWRLRAARSVSSGGYLVQALLGLSLCGVLSAWLGPFVLVPAAVATGTLLFSTQAEKHERWLVTALGAIAVLTPFALEAVGLVPRSYVFAEGRVLLLPRGFALHPGPTLVALLYTSVTFVVLPSFIFGRIRDALTAAEKKLFLHAWHLQQLVSGERDGRR